MTTRFVIKLTLLQVLMFLFLLLGGCATTNNLRQDGVLVLKSGKTITIWDMPGMRDKPTIHVMEAK